jgi:hypothetical protein
MAPMPAFIPISRRMGPLTTTIAAAELEDELRAETSEAARARITGKYAGRAPAMTALTATCSTVNDHGPRFSVGCKWPTTSSGRRLVPASIARTRSSVGSTIGSLSVQPLSRNSWCSRSSLSGSTRRGAALGSDAAAAAPSPRVRPSTTSCMTGRPVTGSLPLT